MTDRQLRDELVTLFLAGHETTAIALTWTFHLLAQNPARRGEAAGRGGRSAGRAAPRPPSTTSSACPTRAWSPRKRMRLYPPAYVFSRRAAGDDQLGPCRMPAGAHIVISPYALHRRPDYWPEPDAFWPERFAPGARTDRPKHAYLPFGGGPRICIGNSFAMMEHAIVLAAAVRRWRLESIPGREVRTEPRITLRPRGGLPMRVLARQNPHVRPAWRVISSRSRRTDRPVRRSSTTRKSGRGRDIARCRAGAEAPIPRRCAIESLITTRSATAGTARIARGAQSWTAAASPARGRRVCPVADMNAAAVSRRGGGVTQLPPRVDCDFNAGMGTRRRPARTRLASATCVQEAHAADRRHRGASAARTAWCSRQHADHRPVRRHAQRDSSTGPSAQRSLIAVHGFTELAAAPRRTGCRRSNSSRRASAHSP